MEKDVIAYFIEELKKTNVKLVPGHWPDFKSKEEVDRWISILVKSKELFQNKP